MPHSLQSVVDSITVAAAVVDQRGRPRLTNARWRDLLAERSHLDDPTAVRLLEELVNPAFRGLPAPPIVHRLGDRWLQTSVSHLAVEGEPAVLVSHQAVHDMRQVQDRLRQVTGDITASTGTDLLRTVTQLFAGLAGARYAFLSVVDEQAPDVMQVVTWWSGGSFGQPFWHPLPHSPSEMVIARGGCLWPARAATVAPQFEWLTAHRIEGFVGLPLRSADGQPLGTIAAFSEDPITKPLDAQLLQVIATRAGTELARLLAEKNARASEERLALAIEATADGSFDWDVAGGRLRGNDRLYAMLGYSREGLTDAAAWRAIVHPDDLAPASAAFVAHLKGETPFIRTEVRLKAHDATWKWVLCRGKVMQRDQQGRAVRMAGLHTDVSDRKRLELQLQVAERLASVGALAASLAHEVNTPLTYLTAGLDKLREQPTDGNALQMALEGAERIREVVRDVKTFSHIEPEAPRSVGDVQEPLRRALRLARREVEMKGTLSEELHPTPAVECNPAQLAHVFLNLVMNAAQALPTGPGQHTVRVKSGTSADGFAEIEVHDNGAGISPDVAPNIFEPFFTTRAAGEGSGLGLAICRSVIAAHGGTLSFESRPGHTVFKVRLPPSGQTLAAPPPPLPQMTPPPPGHVSRRKVLVIDDHAAMGLSLKLMLNEEHDVDTVTDAQAALRLMWGGGYDVILCDLMMPGISGVELYRAVERESPELAKRFVFMTGGAGSSSAARFLEQTKLRVLEKPFRPEALRAVLAG